MNGEVHDVTQSAHAPVEPKPGICATIGLFVMAVLLLGVAPARAGSVDIIVESTKAAPGTVGQFDVVLQNNSASAVDIAGFSVDVLLSDTTNVNFTGINNATIAPYIFSITGSFRTGLHEEPAADGGKRHGRLQRLPGC